MAVRAPAGTGALLLVARLAGLVGPILAKAADLAGAGCTVADLAVL